MNQIPLLHPEGFRKRWMRQVVATEWQREGFNDFYIHNLSTSLYELRLPLPPHRKTVHDFILVTAGSMVKSRGLDQYEVPANSIFMLPAGQITSTTSISAAFQGYYCHFSDHFLINQARSNTALLSFLKEDTQPFFPLSPASVTVLTTLLERLETLYQQQASVNLWRSYLQTILLELQTLSPPSSARHYSAAEKLVLGFKKALLHHAKQQHQVTFYARHLHVSPNHLNRSSQRIAGKTASQLIAEQRLLEAKVLLYQSTLSIQEVSFAVGFQDPSYFGRFFKKHTGQSPSAFRHWVDLSE